MCMDVCLNCQFNCLDKVNEFDDKVVWTTTLELQTDGEKKWKPSRRQIHEKGIRQKEEVREGKSNEDEEN